MATPTARVWARSRTNLLYSAARRALPVVGAERSYSYPLQFQKHCFSSVPEDKEKKKRSKPFLLDLGIPSLIPEWKNMFNSKTILTDVSAGLTVGCVAVPLSLAIAMASGVPAEVGLATAAVSGVAAGLLGGTTLAVTGPAAAISLLVVGAVEAHGLSALPFITIAVGGLQVASGVTRLGIYAKLVPVSVIAGFTTGVGTLILSGQIPKALGMAAPGGLNPIEIVAWVGSNIGSACPQSAALAFGTAAAMHFLPKIQPQIPAALIAVGGATVATHMLGLDVALIGTLPSGLEAFQFAMPVMPPVEALPSLGGSIFLIYFMTTVESLLSCVALEKMRKTSYKHNPDQELVGQGVANLGAGFFLGMPVTSVIARSGLNVKAGAQTRLPAIVQSGFVFGSIVFASSTIAMIPMPALSGMLIKTGASMLYPPEFNYCYSVDNTTTLPFFTTVAGMLTMGLAEGVGVGCVTAVGLAVHKNMKLQVKMQVDEATGDDAVSGKNITIPTMVCERPGVKTTVLGALQVKPTSTVWQVKGPVNFMSMFEIDSLVEEIRDRKKPESPIVLDMRYVTSLDFTGMEELVDRVIEAADGTPVHMVTSRVDINNVMNRIDKDQYVSRFCSMELIE